MRVHQSILDDCARRMQFKLESNQFFGGSVRAVGTGYHKALEGYYRRRMIADHVPSEFALEALVREAQDEFDLISEGGTSHVSESTKEWGGFKWNKAIPDRESAHQALDTMVRAYFDGEHYWPADWKVLDVEQFFELPWSASPPSTFGEHTRGGSIDLILEDPNGWIVGVDQKTAGRAWNKGKESPRKNAQAAWYEWAMQELYPGAPGYRFVFDIMQYNGKFERRISDPGPDHIKAASDLLASTVGMYEVLRANGMDLPANPSSNLCSPEYCDYWNECPHGAVLEGY